MKSRVLWSAGLLLVLTAISLLLWKLGGTHVAASARLPNGIEIYVVQRFNRNLGEPFTTSFFYRTPAGLWGWCYYTHQDDWLWAGRVELDATANRATVFRSDKPVIYFDWDTETYYLLRFNRTQFRAQTWMPAGWTPDWPTLPPAKPR
jgi:hypothetical protein